MRLIGVTVEVETKEIEGRVVVKCRATCPLCGKVIERDDPSQWWPREGDCPHFRGFYSAGGIEMVAYFG